MRAGVRSIEHGSLMDDEAIELMAERGTYLVADMYDGDCMLEDGPSLGLLRRGDRKKSAPTTDAQREGFTKCVKAGVTHRVRHRLRASYPHGVERAAVPELRAARPDADAGDPERDALVARELMRVGGPVGRHRARAASPTSSPCEGDPTDDVVVLEEVPFVMKGGEVRQGATCPTVESA